jgi:cupin fold WbuC family metalloprotein
MDKIVSKKMLDDLTLKAKLSPRKRLNHNFHDDLADPINRMLNALEPGTYLQPHKHENPDKREVFIVVRGSLVVVFFDDSGSPTEFVLLDPVTANHAVEIPVGVWHTLIALKSGSVVYEVKDGPYQPLSDKNFASWAPNEGHQDCVEYLKKLTNQYLSSVANETH